MMRVGGFAGWLLLVFGALSNLAAVAQTGCMTGKVMMSLGANGDIKVCPQYDAKAPELQKQLNAIAKEQAGNRALLLELTHSARGVNALGKDVDGPRQVELLKSFSKQLHDTSRSDQQKTQSQISELANKMDSLKEMIAEKREDAKTSAQTEAALMGQLGDAIAKLDLGRAEGQLDAIQAKLEVIGGDVKATREDTHAIRDRMDAEAAKETKAAADQAKAAKAAEEAAAKDPNQFLSVLILPDVHEGQDVFRIDFFDTSSAHTSFVKSQLGVVVHKGKESWAVRGVDKMSVGINEKWTIGLGDVGDHATVCFWSQDKASGRLKEWMQRYETKRPQIDPDQGFNFLPDGDPSIQLTDSTVCDGVTATREQGPRKSARELAADRAAERMNAARAVAAGGRVGANQPAGSAGSAGPAVPSAFELALLKGLATRRGTAPWAVEVWVQPMKQATFTNEKVQAVMTNVTGQTAQLRLANPQMLGTVETRATSIGQMGTKAVVCFEGKDPRFAKSYRVTEHFTIRITETNLRDGARTVPGEVAVFLPMGTAEVTEASGAACE